jgi:hypothetical protein
MPDFIYFVLLVVCLNCQCALGVDNVRQVSGNIDDDSTDDDGTYETHLWSRLTKVHSRKRSRRNAEDYFINGISRKILSATATDEDDETTVNNRKIISFEKVTFV